MSQEPETTTNEQQTPEKTGDTSAAQTQKDTAATATPVADSKKRAPRRGGKGGRPMRRRERQPRDFEQKIISIRRVTRVVAGGRRFGFSVAMVIGDGRGSVGVGMGKAGDTSLAIEKAINDAKKNMVKINLTDENSISHEVRAKYKSAVVTFMPNYGRGVVAGSAVRSIFELAGIKDVTAKVLTRSKNQVNIARAVIEALQPFITATGKTAVQASLASKPKPTRTDAPRKPFKKREHATKKSDSEQVTK